MEATSEIAKRAPSGLRGGALRRAVERDNNGGETPFPATSTANHPHPPRAGQGRRQRFKVRSVARRVILADVAEAVRACTSCRLCSGRTNAVPGEGNPHATIMLVGEAPGANEDIQGRPFVGMAGKMLNAELEKAGLRREDVFITNVVKCRPPDNRKPKEDEVRACADHLRKQVEAVRPRLLVALGTSAFHALVDTKTPIGEARGKTFPSRLGVPVLATFHPSAILYDRSKKTGTIAADIGAALPTLSK